MKTKKFTQPWFIRRAVYAVVGVVLLVAAGFGLIDEGQIDTITASPILGALVAFLASAKTNAGSDSTVTAQDVAAAASANHGGPSVEAIVAEALNQVQSYGEHAAEVVKDKASQTVADYYNGMK
ncbi:hypothetical protein [Corynebacterium sp.]|uniref:hypothetical protein n=1 Tax=Corynebacterium sp. TaxID=1720 RepID=UPI0025BBEE2D|nr:hypothetical protein [Corynebacterium sp.]